MYKVPQKKCRLKEKPSMKNKKDRDIKDNDYLSWLQTITAQCFHCGTFENIEWHHVKKYSSDRKNDHCCIPLCRQCHTGSIEFSAHGTPKKWRETYSMFVQEFQAKQYYKIYLKEM